MLETKPPTIEIKRVFLGEFESYLNGEKTNLTIVNGSRGLSGRDTQNIYVVCKGGEITRIMGTLQMCKKAVTHWLTKRAKEAPSCSTLS
jgi:hypothetical protein